jgi:glyoxylase-like metal-dependent hydrolase (beta-lactamase superfamily II)
MLSMKPFDTQEVMTDVYAINNNFVNLYLFKSGDKYIAFDAGADNKTTKAALDNLGIDESDVAAVFLTHTDGDHVEAVTLFTSAEIYMSESNHAFISEKDGSSRSKVFIDMEREYKTLGDGETVTIADTEIQCVYTPGHTPGSACFIVNGKYLFTGDNLNLDKDGKAILFSSVFTMDSKQQKQDIRKLVQLEGIEAVFTAHTGYTDKFDAAFADWKSN